jgi:hypothetical protein
MGDYEEAMLEAYDADGYFVGDDEVEDKAATTIVEAKSTGAGQSATTVVPVSIEGDHAEDLAGLFAGASVPGTPTSAGTAITPEEADSAEVPPIAAHTPERAVTSTGFTVHDNTYSCNECHRTFQKIATQETKPISPKTTIRKTGAQIRAIIADGKEQKDRTVWDKNINKLNVTDMSRVLTHLKVKHTGAKKPALRDLLFENRKSVESDITL